MGTAACDHHHLHPHGSFRVRLSTASRACPLPESRSTSRQSKARFIALLTPTLMDDTIYACRDHNPRLYGSYYVKMATKAIRLWFRPASHSTRTWRSYPDSRTQFSRGVLAP